MAICRDCHRKMVFKIPEVKFLLVGSAASKLHLLKVLRNNTKFYTI
jgi:hypothetical protein